MNLRQFNQQPIQPPDPNPNLPTFQPSNPQLPITNYPITIIFPPAANVAVIAGQWQRLDDGSIQATYHDPAQLAWSVHISQWLKQWDSEPPSPPAPGDATSLPSPLKGGLRGVDDIDETQQISMFAPANNYSQEGA